MFGNRRPPRMVYPVDPGCPEVISYMEMGDDPMMQMSGCWSEFVEDFERKHRNECERCRMFGLENIDVEY